MPDGLSLIEFSEDLSDAEAPTPLPPNIYPAKIMSAEPRTSQTTGNKYLSVMFHIDADSYPPDHQDGDPDGMNLAYNRVLLEDNKNARYRLRKFLEAIGGPLGRTLDPSDLLGLTANVDVGEETYEGEKRSVIKRVMSV
jgi:hypothetical protein